MREQNRSLLLDGVAPQIAHNNRSNTKRRLLPNEFDPRVVKKVSNAIRLSQRSIAVLRGGAMLVVVGEGTLLVSLCKCN